MKFSYFQHLIYLTIIQKLFPIFRASRFWLFVVLLGTTTTCLAQDTSNSENSATKPIIFTFQLKEMIGPSAFRTVQEAIEQSEAMNADFLIMELNTYGGLVSSADSIRTALMRTKIPTVSWINNNAASAGALISIACDSIYMSTGANMGASTVVDGEGNKMPDKYQSYMRSTMRSTAEAQGRDPLIAEAMVDERIVVPGIVDSTQILTFTTSEAIEHHYCEGQVDEIHDLISQNLGIKDYDLKKYKPTFLDRVINLLLNPAVNSLLLLLIMGGIWFELQTPGVGFPIIAALIASILFFAPLYLEGLAENWEIALFFVGLLLLALEVFVIPGFGVAGILGILALIISLTFSLIHNDFFDFSISGLETIIKPLFRIIFTLSIAISLFFFFGSAFLNSPAVKRIVLSQEASKDEGFTVKENRLNDAIGQQGIVLNECKPFGRIEVNGEIYEAKSELGWIDRGESVVVIGSDVNNLIVRKV